MSRGKKNYLLNQLAKLQLSPSSQAIAEVAYPKQRPDKKLWQKTLVEKTLAEKTLAEKNSAEKTLQKILKLIPLPIM